MPGRILQKEPMTDRYRQLIEQEIKEVSSKVNSGILPPQILKYLNLDVGSIFVYSVKGPLDKDSHKSDQAEKSYMVDGINIVGFATSEVEKAFFDCKYGDYVKVILAPNSLHALEITTL